MAPVILVAAYLLAIGGGGRDSGRGRTSTKGRGGGRGFNIKISRRGGNTKGRKRYSRDGTKKRPSTDKYHVRQEEVYPLPPLTTPIKPRPSYFTCRHNYENTLIDEIQRYISINNNFDDNDGKVIATSPYPGLVRVEDDGNILPTLYDPVYALQYMPSCVVVTAVSIKGIAREVLAALLGDERSDDDIIIDGTIEKQKQQLHAAQRGSLSIHPLVPGMCKGQTNPIMYHRSTKISDEISKMLKKSYPAARKAAVDDNENTKQSINERWVLQVMLQSSNIAVASLAKSHYVGGTTSYWPNYIHPLGLAKVDIEERMPSSAYRKLMEGIECMGICPSTATTVIDLGACPGGWSSVMRRYFDCKVIAVDRSELDPVLMKDSMVEFVKGDAFSYKPPNDLKRQDTWMISDVIAYPERITELLNEWCSNEWASNMIVTMKFQGNEPDLDELDRAVQIVQECGYNCRVKHFFNNKNEVTFMISEKNDTVEEEVRSGLGNGIVGSPMYLCL